MDAVQVGAELPQDGQQYEGDQQSQQRGRDCGIRDYLQWQHISMLRERGGSDVKVVNNYRKQGRRNAYTKLSSLTENFPWMKIIARFLL